MAGSRTKRRWALDADLKAAFDHASHDHILRQLGTFPARERVAGWLKAGVIEDGRFAPTEEGTPQGGVISPLIFSIALHGMEEAAGAAYRWNPYREAESAVPGTPVLVRYADDLVALCDSREQAEQAKARLGPWLAARGLAFNEEKTRVVHLDEGFDFLGFNVRRYGQKLLIKPSAGAVRRIRKRLADEVRALRGANATAVIRTIAPIVRGWSAYYRGVVSTETFHKLDHYLWQLLYKWALYRHNHRSRHQIVKRYFGQFHPRRKDRWVFGNRETGAYLPRFGWTKIVRHDLVKGRASPDDPALAGYWAARRRKEPPPPVSADRLRLLRKQQGRCPLCGNLLLHADREPQSPAGMGAMGIRDRESDRATRDHRPGQPGGQNGKAPCPRALPKAARPPAAERHRWPACEPSGTCLSRGAGKARKPGSEGRAAQQCAALTRPRRQSRQAPPGRLRLLA